MRADRGLSISAVAELTGMSQRQLRLLAQSDIVRPSVRAPAGPGISALYAVSDVLMLVLVEQLRAVCGGSLPRKHLRNVVDTLRTRRNVPGERLVLEVSGCWIQRGSLDRTLGRSHAALVFDLDSIAEETQRRLRRAGLVGEVGASTRRGRLLDDVRRWKRV